MRLRPLRGQTYETVEGHMIRFIENKNGICSVLFGDEPMSHIHISEIALPIINTKDYEKIPDEKYRGD